MHTISFKFYTAEAAIQYARQHLDAANRLALPSISKDPPPFTPETARLIDQHLDEYRRGLRAWARLREREQHRTESLKQL